MAADDCQQHIREVVALMDVGPKRPVNQITTYDVHERDQCFEPKCDVVQRRVHECLVS